jgi:hypothetical protein
MQGMRRAAGILLTLVGAIMLAIYGFVMMRLPIPGFLLSRLGIVSLWVDPVGAPICAAVFLMAGTLLLLRRKAKPTGSTSR